VTVFDGKLPSTEKNQIHGLCKERRSPVVFTYTRISQLQELGLAVKVTKTLENESELQGFAEATNV
jgi:hypothetical protein